MKIFSPHACIFFLSLTIPGALFARDLQGVVTGDFVRVRESSSLTSQTNGYRFRGNTLTILEQVQGDAFKGNKLWYRIRALDLYEGFIHSDFVLIGKQGLDYRNALSPDAHDSLLKKDFTGDLVREIKKHQKRVHGAKRDQDLEGIYRNTRRLSDLLEETLQKKYDKIYDGTCKGSECHLKFSYLDQYIPGTYIAVVAEGTVAKLFADPAFFYEKAKQTRGGGDDSYFELEKIYYGKTDRLWPAFTERTWDYGGHSLLGQNIHFKILKQVDLHRKSSPLFKEEVQTIRSSTINDILQYNLYYEKKEAIIKEIRRIQDQIELTSEERASLEDRIQAIETPSESIHVNCKEDSCPYG